MGDFSEESPIHEYDGSRSERFRKSVPTSTHFHPMFHFYTPWGTEMEHSVKMC